MPDRQPINFPLLPIVPLLSLVLSAAAGCTSSGDVASNRLDERPAVRVEVGGEPTLSLTRGDRADPVQPPYFDHRDLARDQLIEHRLNSVNGGGIVGAPPLPHLLSIVSSLVPQGVPASDSTLALHPVLTLSGHEIPFGEIRSIVADDDGRMFVADRQSNEIWVFGPDGTDLARLGGAGDGPGEFSGIQGAMAWSEGVLYVIDHNGRRINTFHTSAEVVHARTYLWRGPDQAPPPLRVFPSDQGAVFGVSVVPPPLPRLELGRDPPPRGRSGLQHFRIDMNGTVAPFPSLNDSVQWPSAVFCAAPDGSVVHPLPTPSRHGRPLRAFLPSGLVAIASRDSYRVEVRDPVDGSLAQTIERDVDRYPLFDAEWERQPEIRELRALEEEAGARLVGLGGGPCPVDALRPTHKPVIRAVTTDEKGRIWIESSGREGMLLTRFEVAGQSVRSTRMPERDPRVDPHIHADRMYIVTVDELGVQSIEVFAIEEPR